MEEGNIIILAPGQTGLGCEICVVCGDRASGKEKIARMGRGGGACPLENTLPWALTTSSFLESWRFYEEFW
jgi:hypothetical protein